MRYINYIFIILLLSSCASQSNFQEWESGTIDLGYDFREYTEQGFLFTPEKYSDQYESIGMVEIIFRPHIREALGQARAPHLDGYDIKIVGLTHYYVERPRPSELIYEMYVLANEMGADALSNFQVAGYTLNNGNSTIDTIKVSGFAIRRH